LLLVLAGRMTSEWAAAHHSLRAASSIPRRNRLVVDEKTSGSKK
jgi:hypothetical protein